MCGCLRWERKQVNRSTCVSSDFLSFAPRSRHHQDESRRRNAVALAARVAFQWLLVMGRERDSRLLCVIRGPTD